MISRILLVLALAVLAYMVYITMNCNDNTERSSTRVKPCNNNNGERSNYQDDVRVSINTELAIDKPKAPISNEKAPISNEKAPFSNHKEHFSNESIRYTEDESFENNVENFASPDGIAGDVKVASPFGTGDSLTNLYAPVPATFKGGVVTEDKSKIDDENDVYQIDGTDLLTAPLADRFYYTNSIANVNRNASSDLRGDIPITYNDNYTPFYQSTIYGEPLTVNRLA
jgi:hypothetical protein